MRVLITGGYGFIGSFVSQQFYQEGHEVAILDNLSTGDKRNVEFKHKSYILSVEDRNCEEVFRNNPFDVVIHLAAQVNVGTSMENPRLDTKSNILGLSNMLALAKKYQVKKFIFASSAAVYGMNGQIPIPETTECNPVSPYGLNKWVGESYCRKWKDIYGLETLCFRFSNVYGPRQGGGGEGGVVSIFMERAIQGKELFIYGDGLQSRDFIYVEDVAEAIYRASYSSMTGVYNLSTCSELSVRKLCEMIGRMHGGLSVSHKEGKSGDIYRSVLDNRRVMTDLDWAPRYDMEEGLRRTYEWFRKEKPPVVPDRSEEHAGSPVLGSMFRRMLPYLENMLAFALIVWLTFTLEDRMNSHIDFKLLYIIVMGIVYGNRQSIVAVSMSIGLYIYVQLSNGREWVSLLYDTELFYQVAVYLFIGLVVGYAIERQKSKVQSREQELETLNGKHTFLNDVYNETRLVKDELQRQIMKSGDSFGKIYSIIKELESLEPEKIFASTVNVVETIMKSNSVSIYTVNKYGSFLRLAAKSASADVPKSLKVEATPFAGHVLHGKRLYVNKEIRSDAPLLSAPVLNNGEVVAVISIHQLQFENFTLYDQNLFKVTVDLISSALSRAYTYVTATENARYVEGTPVLHPEVFQDIIASKQMAKARNGIEYVLLIAGESTVGPADLPHRISSMLRETDYIGLGENGQLMVLLSNSSVSDAEYVMERFHKNGIAVRPLHAEAPVKDIRYA